MFSLQDAPDVLRYVVWSENLPKPVISQGLLAISGSGLLDVDRGNVIYRLILYSLYYSRPMGGWAVNCCFFLFSSLVMPTPKLTFT